MSSHYPAIVTDGLWRKSLSAIRSLGKSGYRVHVMGNSVFTTGFWSRFTFARIRAPLASDNTGAFGKALIEELRKIGSNGAPPVLLPMEDPSLLWVSENRSKLSDLARFALAPHESILIASDKSLTLKLAQQLAIPAPLTLWPENPRQALESIRSKFEGKDWVLKPIHGSGSKGILYGSAELAGSSRLESILERRWKEHGRFLLQERIPATGRGIGASFLIGEKGQVIAEFLHERIHQYPVTGGPSTNRKSVHHPEIREQSLKLLRELKWKGVAMVEWKTDPRSGEFKLMEINPRFWGSLELAVRSGVDFPSLYAELCLGQSRSLIPPSYADGVRCRWMIPGEILRYLSTPRADRESLSRFLAGLPAVAEEWDRRDLSGALATLICIFALALNPRYWKYVRRG